MTEQTHTPVLISGAGPIGMTLALELATHGVRSTLVERNPHTTTFPKMDLTNIRSMELYHRLGIDADVRAAGVGPTYSFDVIFASAMSGEEVTRWSLPSVDQMRATIAERGRDGGQPQEPWQRISQIQMEELLMLHCLENELIEVLRPFRVTGVEQDADGVTTTIESRDGDETRRIRASYVVGCDGANSAVRDSLGITESGDRAVATLSQVHFQSRDMRTLHAHGQFWHVFFLGRGFAAIIAQDEVDTWTVHQQLFEDVRLSDLDPMRSLHETLGRGIEIDRLLETSIWRPNVLVADRYRNGRVFLAGDAAHQFIPTGGYGMNTGIADAVDIGWKLAAVIQGWGGPRLLDSYEPERQPVAITSRDHSFRHLSVHLQAQEMADETLIAADTPEGAEHRARLAEHYTKERGENESWGWELGYRYDTSPIIAHEEGEGPEQPWNEYHPTTWPGSRAPHVDLAAGGSPLDAFRIGFTLVEFNGDGDRLESEARRLKIPFRRLNLSGDDNARKVYERDLVLVRPDGHVAWRGNSAPDDAAGLLASVTGQVTP
jgi:2-polyprenyl-6-methoxyphenol hydroxylase-like FAD-dependent oxidoreductase